jgi:hypothetical protein
MNDLITLLDYLKQNPGARLSFSYDDWPGVPIAKYRASIEAARRRRREHSDRLVGAGRAGFAAGDGGADS